MFKPLHLSKQLVNAGLAESVSSWTRQWSRDGVHPVTFGLSRNSGKAFRYAGSRPVSGKLPHPLPR